MQFREIAPFVRYARYLHLDSAAAYAPHTPYDARLFYVLDGEGRIDVMRPLGDCGGLRGKKGASRSGAGNAGAAVSPDGRKQIFSCPLQKGDVLMINSGVQYHLVTPPRRISYLAVNFDYTQAASGLTVPIPPDRDPFYRPEALVAPATFEDVEELNDFFLLREMGDLEQKLLTIEDEYAHQYIYSALTIGSLFSAVLVEVARKIRFQPLSGGVGGLGKITPRIIIDYIHENYNQPLTNADIGAAFGYHPNYVNTLVRLYTGMPLHQYLLRIRVGHATDYLDAGVLSVSDIARACGFGSLYYFSRYFKKCTGLSPTEYRRQ